MFMKFSFPKMITKCKYLFSILVCLLLLHCKEAYQPPAIANAPNYLVVEGFINTNETSYIYLSRTVNLKDTINFSPESNASLYLEDEQSSSLSFVDQGNGRYTLNPFGLKVNKKYQLRIKTSTKEYLSDFVEAQNSPKIDSINYKIQNKGVQFFANTNDPTNLTKYYRWDFEETWLYKSLYDSKIEYKNSELVFRDINNSIYRCWRTEKSKNIIVGSSANLSTAVLVDNPINFVSAASGKISFGYSILVRQYALSKEAFDYWQNLKKNTEQLGSIFDPQPSIASGNIHCVNNPLEPVIGYLSASNVSSLRKYFDNRSLPFDAPSYLGPPNRSDCDTLKVMISPEATFASRTALIFTSGNFFPTEPIAIPGIGIIGYTYSSKDCVDCRLKGGTSIKPSFWPY